MIQSVATPARGPKRPAPYECSTPHRSLVPCATCGGTPPRSDLLSPFSKGRDDAGSWWYWFGRNIIMPEPSDPTPPEQLRAIEAATKVYQDACAAYDRAVQAYATAVTRELRAKQGGLSVRYMEGQGSVRSRPEIIAGARADATAAESAVDAANRVRSDALRELNRVSKRGTHREEYGVLTRIKRWILA